ncbi:MAG: DNA polymerase III subunit alpha [Gammaproteobacteria bacterium]|nr:DNA polymerase III subunit alpha [Gammaproteobacteria bacterium]MBT5203675.1 DNA polymerase III subunit alpha [Gammaproteobacteria bacterium]
MTLPFVHLRIHSEYSIADGLVRIKELVSEVRSQGMPAVAISDINNLFALVKLYQTALEQGIKPIVACDVLVEDLDKEGKPSALVLVAQSAAGYQGLSRLLSKAYTDGQASGKPTLSRDWIAQESSDLIALSAAMDGDIGKAITAGNLKDAVRRTACWQEVFPERFYIELQRTGASGEADYVSSALDVARETSCPVVATNNVRFLHKAQFDAHEVRVCIHEGRTADDPRREKRYTEEQYLKSSEQMAELFSDIPEAIENTYRIAQRCSVMLTLGKSFLPEYPVPAGKTMKTFLEDVALEGLEDRFSTFPEEKKPADENWRKAYLDRLSFELGVINNMGFPGYFLIVMEFIQWAKDNDIPVGPGRGSGAGSLVAYVLGITDIDPLEYDLLFERFLNPERVSLPDFDIDFCMDGRDRVIQHVTERYGYESVSQIITFGTMAAKAVVRDVARVQGKPYSLADKLSKLIPFEPGMTLAKAMEEEPLLAEFVAQSADAEEIMEMAYKLEGLARNIGRHAGGVVIAPTLLTDFTPVYKDDSNAAHMTQYDMNDVEKVGLVKFDFLGLRTLTIIDKAVKSINARAVLLGEPEVNINELDLEDEKIYEDLREAKTTSVFQLESRGMKDLMKRVRPSRFADIVALVALFRPGPLQLADDFIRRKHGIDEVDYLHPSLKGILVDTYGVMLYQEQVMQIAQILAGYSLADADLLRRAMGKKKPEEMAKQREIFIAGAMKNDVSEKQSDYIFGLMEKFAGYGFNKPHSVCYALIAYHTAWLKHYYPADFMAAVMSADMQNTDKIVTTVEECRDMGLDLSPPNVNEGEYRFTPKSGNEIVYGLGAIKGLGEGAISAIVESRHDQGRYSDLFEFCKRVDPRKINRRALDALVGSGSLDDLVPDQGLKGRSQIDLKRALLYASQEEAVKMAEQDARNVESGTDDLFGGFDADVNVTHPSRPEVKGLSMQVRLSKEKETLGLYLTGHPIDLYRPELKHLAGCKVSDLRASQAEQTVAGWVVGLRSMKSQRGAITFATLDDRSGRVDVSIFSDLLEQSRDKICKDSLLVVRGVVSNDEYSGGLRMRSSEIYDLVEARGKFAKSLKVRVSGQFPQACLEGGLAELLTPYKEKQRDGCPVVIHYSSRNACAELVLGDEWRVNPDDDLIELLRDKFGRDEVSIDYTGQSRLSR